MTDALSCFEIACHDTGKKDASAETRFIPKVHIGSFLELEKRCLIWRPYLE